jgi:heme/copper-type cytochrome/quinol oxidase subunit 1
MALTEAGPRGDDATDQDAGAEARAEEQPPPPSVGGGARGNDHKVVGTELIVLALLFLVVGGVLALVMRAQLSTANGSVVNDTEYRSLFTYHGTFLVFLFLLPAWLGIATAMVPLQIGAGRLAFPRLQTLALWMALAGGALMTIAPFASGGKLITGWSFTVPIPDPGAIRGDGVEYLLLGIAIVLAGAVLAAANLVTTILKLRAPGLTARRLPLYSWSVLVSSAVLLLSLPVLVAGTVMLFADHHYRAHLFSGLTSSGAGNPFLWPRLFWFGAYPMLWALLLPVLGLASEVLPVFARRPIADRTRAMVALAAVGVLAFFGWGSEVRNLERARFVFVLGALAVLAPVASLFLNWLLTVAKAATGGGLGADRLLATPMLHVLGVVSVLAVGLAAGAVSAVDASRSLHANYWQVGEQHLLFFAPATLAVVAAVHYWAPKLWGRGLSQGVGRLEVLLLAGGAFVSFLPALVLGLQHMHVHTSSYPSHDSWRAANLVMSAGSAVLTLGVLVFALNLLVSVAMRRGRPAPDDPWGGHTLEWTAPTPPPPHNFDRLPEVRSATPALDLRGAEVG